MCSFRSSVFPYNNDIIAKVKTPLFIFLFHHPIAFGSFLGAVEKNVRPQNKLRKSHSTSFAGGWGRGGKMKIYVGTFKKYNEGSLFGRWMDLEDYYDLYEFYMACRELHQDEDDPEFMFQDFEDIPDSLISESSIDEDIYELVHFEGDLEALYAFISLGNYNCLSDYIESFNYAFLTKLESCNDELTALGYWAAEGGYYDIPEELENFVDYEKIGASIQYDYNIINGYLFNNHV